MKYKFEAMDATGMEIKDVVEAEDEGEAMQLIRQMGYFVTKIARKNGEKETGNELLAKISSIVRERDFVYCAIIVILILMLLFSLLSR